MKRLMTATILALSFLTGTVALSLSAQESNFQGKKKKTEEPKKKKKKKTGEEKKG